MHPLAPFLKYFAGSIVGAATVVQALRIAQLELGNTVEGVIFRIGIRTDEHDGDDEEL